MEEMATEVVELVNLAVLGDDEVGLEMQFMPTDDEKAPAAENVPASKNKGEEVYNTDWVHGGIFRWHLTGASNQNL